MNQSSRIFIALILIIGVFSSVDGFALAEAGVGLLIPGGAGDLLGEIVLVPNVMLNLGPIGIGADLWYAPGHDLFYLFPYLLIKIPLPVVSLYGGLAPRIWGSSEGFNLMPPFLELYAKAGVEIGAIPLLKIYGEAIFTILPLTGGIAGVTLSAGARIGF